MAARIRVFRTAQQIKRSADAERAYDQRRAKETETRRLYWTANWRRIAKQQLHDHPLCVRCAALDVTEPASVCDHREPHRGDVDRFWAGPFDSLCKSCHDSAKQREDKAGFRSARWS